MGKTDHQHGSIGHQGHSDPNANLTKSNDLKIRYEKTQMFNRKNSLLIFLILFIGMGVESIPGQDLGDSAPKVIATGLKLNAKLKLSELLRFDEENKPVSRPFELVVDAVGEKAKDAIEIGWAKLDSAKAPDGTDVGTVQPLSDFFDLSNKFKRITKRGAGIFSKHPQDGVRVSFEIERTDNNWAKLSNIKGSLRIKAGGDRKLVKHEEASLNLGAIESNELKSRGISAVVSKIGIDTLTIRLTGKDLSGVYRVAILSPEQKELSALKASSWSRQEDGVTHSFSFSPSPPADATVFLFIAENLQEFEIPFEFPELELNSRN